MTRRSMDAFVAPASRRLRQGVAAALGLAVLAPSHAAVAGEPVGVSWAGCSVAPAVDADRDGLDDACEAQLAMAFQPELVFGKAETKTDRTPYWAARPDGAETVRIFYALAYHHDAGDPTYYGASAHDGDSEFVVLRVRYDGAGSWSLVEGYLSSHYGTYCDSGGWFPATKFQYATSPGGRPLVFVAEGKHANYTDLESCDWGGCYQDHCSDQWRELVGVTPGRDLGVASTRLLDQQIAQGNPEWFWTDVIFCGWQRDGMDARTGCVPQANSYGRQLVDLAMDFGPVTPGAGTCAPCTVDADCRDGGTCAAGACGRACDDLGPACPSGTHCELPAFGVGQCRPDTNCACLSACTSRECGDDGCGGTCGECDAGTTCSVDGLCVPLEASGGGVPPEGKFEDAPASVREAGCAVGRGTPERRGWARSAACGLGGLAFASMVLRKRRRRSLC